MVRSARPCLLVCDDEEGIRESFKLILEDDYELTFAENGPAAIEAVKTAAFDAVILDIKMPKIHGMDVLKQIKAIRPSLPVIIVTGYQSVEMAQQAAQLGAFDYIPKPFDTRSVKERVRQALASK